MAGKPPPMMKLKLATSATKISQNAPYPRGLSSRTLQRQAAASTSFPHDTPLSHLTSPPTTTTQPTLRPSPPPLSILPLPLLLRNILISTISSSRLLLPPSLATLSYLASSPSPFLNPDRNPLLRALLKRSFYAHFCAGETPTEVSRTINSLKEMGYKGVMLCYAREVVLDARAAAALEASGGIATEAVITNEILPWKQGTLKTVSLVAPGGFVAVKLTGAGSQALYNLSHNLPLSPALEDAITSVCDLAAARGVRLVFDAEQAALQTGIDSWVLDLMRRYNKKSAVVYSTYQAYLKACPEVLARHLAVARKEGFVAGVKLVRGAYINSDPRHLINDTKEDTDIMYDALAESVLRRTYNSILTPSTPAESAHFPEVSLALASHNPHSVRRAMAIQESQASAGEPRIDLVYGQLQGMADEVSCELVQRAVEVEGQVVVGGEEKTVVPKAYKYLVWGTTGECMKYLARRGQENKDAVQRTREGRDLMVGEVGRRVRGVLGW
ncbi:hypothetical protein VE02_04675 [Pseudogymnoascus sp. 03VT05]|nr:hypothetical protein VE02_04675 [Pseudogymnoascus sp. 03VT05]